MERELDLASVSVLGRRRRFLVGCSFFLQILLRILTMYFGPI